MAIWNQLFKKPEVDCVEYLPDSIENFSSIVKMIQLQNKLISTNSDIEINLKDCYTLSATNSMLLSSISLIRKDSNLHTILSIDGNKKIFDYLTEINFLHGKNTKNFNMEPKPFKTEEEIKNICNEIKSSSKFNSIDKDERNILISKTYELLINSWEHGKNNIGAICHCFYRNEKFIFSVYDFGIGIPEKVKTYLNDQEMSDIEAIKWALDSGNSTKLTSNSEFPSGSGLKLIEKFLADYNGRIIICSGEAYYLIHGSKIQEHRLPCKIVGTLITLTVPINRQNK